MRAAFPSFLLIVVFALGAGAVQAQNATLRGYVTDAETGAPLQGATVVLDDGARLLGAATDGDGAFRLLRVPPGTYTLRASFIGYAAHEEAITLARGQVEVRRLRLVPQEAAIDEVVVEAPRETGVTAVAAGLQTLDAAQIERVPMPGVTGDLASYLQTVPGIVLQGDRGGQLFVRGGALDQNLALLDGLLVYLPFHILSFYSAFPEELIDGADLYTGGFGARYGARVSSVVDVRARNGNKQRVAGMASAALFLSTLQVEGPLVPNRVSFLGSLRQSLVEQAAPELFGQRFPYRFGDRFGKLHALLNASNSISVTALHTFDRGDLAGTRRRFDGAPVTNAIPPDSVFAAWENTVVGGRYEYRSNRLPLRAELVGGRSAMRNEVGPEAAPERSSEIESLDAAVHTSYTLRGGHELRAGGTWRRTDLAYALGGQFQNLETGATDLTEVGAYAEAALLLRGGRLRIQPGLHVYALSDRGQQWLEPRLRATATLLDPTGRPHQVSAAAGLYHQTLVGLTDERDVGNVFTAWVTTPEEAPAPAAVHAIVGWNGQILPWLSLAAEGFYKRFDHLSVPVFSPLLDFTTALQPADGNAMGLDVRAEVQNRPFAYESTLDGYVSYAFSTVEYEAAQVTYHPGHDRRHQVQALVHVQRGEVGLTAQYQFGSGLPFTASSGFDEWFVYTPGVDVTNEPATPRVLYDEPFAQRQPPYERLDLWADRRVERGRLVATLRAGIVNVLNRRNLFYFDLFTLQRVDQLPLTPSLGLKLEVR